jgi:hypothetical protein
LHENVQVILNDEACQQVLEQLDVDVIDAFELKVVKPHNCVLHNLSELFQVTRAFLHFDLHGLKIIYGFSRIENVSLVKQKPILVNECRVKFLNQLVNRVDWRIKVVLYCS